MVGIRAGHDIAFLISTFPTKSDLNSYFSKLTISQNPLHEL